MLKIAIANDSMMAAESLRRVINSVPDYQLVWVAYDGREAVAKCGELCPDIILMDLYMPEMDGIEATRLICAQYQCAILIVTASVDGHAGKVFEAMGAGAVDAVNTPILGDTGDGEGAGQLTGKIRSIATLRRGTTLTPGDSTPPAAASGSSDDPPLIALGASTGGPAALRQVLQALPPEPGVAIAIVQHVDEQFAASFTQWLNEQVPLQVRAALPGEPPALNTALVCSREEHLVMRADGRLDYNPQPREVAYRPSVDVFFHSLAENYKNQAIGVLLTGMGKDGAVGLRAMRERDWCTLAQDEASSAVYGMPKAAKELDAACEILSLVNIGPRLAEWAEEAALLDA